MTTGDTGAVRGDARAAVDQVVTRLLQPATPHDSSRRARQSGREPKVGDRVIVGGFGLEGVVTGLHDGAAEVDVRGKRMRASVRDLARRRQAPGAR